MRGRRLGALAVLVASMACPLWAQEELPVFPPSGGPPPPREGEGGRPGGPGGGRPAPPGRGPRPEGGPRDGGHGQRVWLGPARPFDGNEGARVLGPMRLERSAYLGVVAEQADEALRNQLGLPAGVGLVVETVEPGGPAAQAGLQEHDVLHKLNDQLLINEQQFAVLVRTFKPGEQVELTLLRKAKPTTITATLGEKELPPLSSRPDILRRLGPMEFDHPEFVQPGFVPGGFAPTPGRRMGSDETTIHSGDRRLRFWWDEQGARQARVEDADGRAIFEGPVSTPEQRAAAPAEVRQWLDRLGGSGAGGAQTQPAAP